LDVRANLLLVRDQTFGMKAIKDARGDQHDSRDDEQEKRKGSAQAVQ
jgi:hypothetical protein